MNGAETDCPFCHSDMAFGTFWARDGLMAVYNHAPILPGHSLIIPASHFTSIQSLDSGAIHSFFLFARKVTAFLCQFFGSDGFDWSLQEGSSAGQSIAHLHLHIVPRLSGDLKDPGAWYKLLYPDGMESGVDQDFRKLPNEVYLDIAMKLRLEAARFFGGN